MFCTQSSSRRRSNRGKQPKKYFPIELADSEESDDESMLSDISSPESISSTSSSSDSSSCEDANADNENSTALTTGGKVKKMVEEKKIAPGKHPCCVKQQFVTSIVISFGPNKVCP